MHHQGYGPIGPIGPIFKELPGKSLVPLQLSICRTILQDWSYARSDICRRESSRVPKRSGDRPEALGNRCGQEKHQGNLLCFKVLSFSDDFVENPEAHIIIRHSFKYPFHGC